MISVFRKVMVADRLPAQGIGYFTDEGYLNYGYNDGEGRMLWTCYNEGYEEDPSWWLEEIELPSEEEVAIVSEKRVDSIGDTSDNWLREHDFEMGAHFILNHIKEGGKK